MIVPGLATSPNAAANAYRAATTIADAPTDAGSFSAALGRAVQSAIETGHTADQKALQGINGTANVTEVVSAVSKAELALQTGSAIRDRMVQAYQDIMRMPI